MQIDMHYYGVYAMARAAGLSKGASAQIATASELVDDNAEEEHVEFGDGGRLDLMPTAHHTTDIENRDEEMQRKVWVPFHFIPGNRGRTVAERSCAGKIAGSPGRWWNTRSRWRIAPLVLSSLGSRLTSTRTRFRTTGSPARAVRSTG